jgi:hypothetical protein
VQTYKRARSLVLLLLAVGLVLGAGPALAAGPPPGKGEAEKARAEKAKKKHAKHVRARKAKAKAIKAKVGAMKAKAKEKKPQVKAVARPAEPRTTTGTVKPGGGRKVLEPADKARRKKIAKEKRKHADRIAKIERIISLAKKKDAPKLAKKASKLREKEMQRHRRAMVRLRK